MFSLICVSFIVENKLAGQKKTTTKQTKESQKAAQAASRNAAIRKDAIMAVEQSRVTGMCHWQLERQ